MKPDDAQRPGILLFGAVMTLFGLASMDFNETDELPASVIVRALEPLGFNEPAIRATLRRNATKGLLAQRRVGTEVRFTLSETGRSLVAQGRQRVNDPNALRHTSDEWTLLTFPEGPAMRNERYQLNLRLAWAGFGRLMPGVWITPGRADVSALLNDAFEGNPPVDALGFKAVALESTAVAPMIARAWNLAAIRSEHDKFLATWSHFSVSTPAPLADLVHLLNDWSTLLLADPGLPDSGVPAAWPAPESMRALNVAKAALWEPARAQLKDLLGI